MRVHRWAKGVNMSTSHQENDGSILADPQRMRSHDLSGEGSEMVC